MEWVFNHHFLSHHFDGVDALSHTIRLFYERHTRNNVEVGGLIVGDFFYHN